MVCEKCESKLSKLSTPDVWKSKNIKSASSDPSGRKVNENKALTSSKFNPINTNFKPCRICKQKVHQSSAYYCQQCSFKKAICCMCGKKLLNVKNYKQSSA